MSWPPSGITTPVSYVEILNNDVTEEAACTSINFTGTMAAVNSVGGGGVEVGLGIQEVASDPVSPLPGDSWVLRVTTQYLSHSIATIGLSVPTISYSYYLKYRTARNTTVSVELT